MLFMYEIFLSEITLTQVHHSNALRAPGEQYARREVYGACVRDRIGGLGKGRSQRQPLNRSFVSRLHSPQLLSMEERARERESKAQAPAAEKAFTDTLNSSVLWRGVERAGLAQHSLPTRATRQK